jgi:hypothetical protein
MVKGTDRDRKKGKKGEETKKKGKVKKEEKKSEIFADK